MLWTRLRTANSGFVFFDRTAAMMSERFSGETLSIPWTFAYESGPNYIIWQVEFVLTQYSGKMRKKSIGISMFSDP